MSKVSRSIEVNVPPKVMFETCLDFENYPDFLPDVISAEIKSKKTEELIVDFKINVIKSVAYTLKIKPTPHKKISWTLVKGELFKKNDGEWKFEAKGKGKTLATYSLDIDLGLVPSFISKKLIGSNLPTMMKRFKQRAES